ncbi:aa3-type cytochrome c oxidase subunit IV [Novosphingobium hassiacum]
MKMASANDMKAANATYEGFVNLVKWATPIICVLAFVVVLVIQ